MLRELKNVICHSNKAKEKNSVPLPSQPSLAEHRLQNKRNKIRIKIAHIELSLVDLQVAFLVFGNSLVLGVALHDN